MLERTLLETIRADWGGETATRAVAGEAMFCLGSRIGARRRENQDRIAAMRLPGGRAGGPASYVFALCDGVGGAAAGAESAAAALAAFLGALAEDGMAGDPGNEAASGAPASTTSASVEDLRAAALRADAAAQRAGGGATTLTAVLLSGSDIRRLNVGDSRIYSFSRRSGIRRHTVDDSVSETLGGDDPALLQYVGMGRGLRPHIGEIEAGPDLILLTSDGLHCINAETFEAVVRHASSPREACDRLISTAKWTGSTDDASLAVVATDLPLMEPAPGEGEAGAGIIVWTPFGRHAV